MAVTRIWPVRGRIKAVIDYAANPQKTEISLQNVLEYAANGMKTEKGMYVSGLNCDPAVASTQFRLIKKQFNKQDSINGIAGYHAYQSFAAGEVTPEQAHKIGREMAQRLWGDAYQVVIATHLDQEHIHNHFVVNSVSFVDGKRCRQKQWNELHRISDEVCRTQGLSVIENPQGKRVPLTVYKAEKAGKPTRLNLAKAAFDEALAGSRNLQEVKHILKKQGYLCSFDAQRKYWTIKQKNWQRPIRLARMGEDYTNEAILERLRKNALKNRQRYPPQRERRMQYRLPTRKDKIQKKSGLQRLYLYYCYLLGYLPKYQQSAKRIHYLYRDDLLKLKNLSDEAKFLVLNNVNTLEDLLQMRSGLERKISELCTERNEYRNMIRRIGTPAEGKEALREQIAEIGRDLKSCRRQICLCDSILSRTAELEKKIEAAEKELKKERTL